jgi:hypothetical protein
VQFLTGRRVQYGWQLAQVELAAFAVIVNLASINHLLNAKKILTDIDDERLNAMPFRWVQARSQGFMKS